MDGDLERQKRNVASGEAAVVVFHGVDPDESLVVCFQINLSGPPASTYWPGPLVQLDTWILDSLAATCGSGTVLGVPSWVLG